jgi:hypothetical protein
MARYVIRTYQEGFEPDQVKIGVQVAQDWIWPYAFDLVGLLRLRAQPGFDPGTRHYCFLDGEMVGYVFSVIAPPGDSEDRTAHLEFPRVLPGHEGTAELLMDCALETLKAKAVSRAVGRVTTMCPGDIELAEVFGFRIYDWGHKVYYAYEMAWGVLEVPSAAADEIELEEDLSELAALAARWYGRSPDWSRAHLREWHRARIIAHLCVRERGKPIAACLVAPNDVRPSTAALFYVQAPDEDALKPMLARAVEACIEHRAQDLIADLVNEHRKYQGVYEELGFKAVAQWARCERALD